MHIIGILAIALTLAGCIREPKGFQTKNYAGKSSSWSVSLDVENESTRIYKFRYIGEGEKPNFFTYEIKDNAGTKSNSGEGELDNMEVFQLTISCGNPCDPLPDSIPVTIQWQENNEKLSLKLAEK
ncbi:hypothetical protein [Bacillus sp. B-jedd]|uniref:hypothetical protein n=1 Tax=Bacillus sp. B-jedd TaxID=1476857 RepID=UPI0005155440|nr:hypothetical protein [Bacillus sp. B-jedd]CEG28395.1 hypothetical protein BN1002_03311 [Bacillus sp. B-jedd]